MLDTKLLTRRTSIIATAIIALAVPFAYGMFKGGLTSNAQRAQITSDNLEIELITQRPAGVEPAEITRPKGPFVLFVDDRSGKENSSLVLQRVNGEQLRAVSLTRRKSDWRDVVDLSPGSYVLKDQSNSDLSCQITILP